MSAIKLQNEQCFFQCRAYKISSRWYLRRLNVHFSKAMSTCYYLLLYYYEEYSRRVALWRVLTPKMGHRNHQPRCWRGDMSKWNEVSWCTQRYCQAELELVKLEKGGDEGELHDWQTNNNMQFSNWKSFHCNYRQTRSILLLWNCNCSLGEELPDWIEEVGVGRRGSIFIFFYYFNSSFSLEDIKWEL